MSTEYLESKLILKARNLGGSTVACELINEELARRKFFKPKTNTNALNKRNT